MALRSGCEVTGRLFYALAVALTPLSLASAILLFVINLIGLGLGPLAIGALNDALTASYGTQAIRYSLFIMVATNLWAAYHFFAGARTIRADIAAAG